MSFFCHFFPCQELRPPLTAEVNERGSKKRELDQLRRRYIQEKDLLSLKCGSSSGGDFTRQPLMLNYITERISLTDDHLRNANS